MAENYFGITDTGKQRTNNEDSFFTEALQDDSFIAACVIDGLGGYEGGEVAAALAHTTILKNLKDLNGEPGEKMTAALQAANASIYAAKQGSKEYGQMACVVTLALADMSNNKFYYAHVGDTRLYLLRDHSLVKITSDQSFVGFLEDNGKISEEEAMRHPKRNEINKALGFDAFIGAESYIETGSSPFLPGDMILLCSDGLSDMINSNTITDILTSDKTVEEKGNALIDAANEAGGEDNITVVLVHNNKQQVKQEATKPLVKKNDLPATSSNGDDSTNAKTVFKESRFNKKTLRTLTILFIILLATFAWLLYRNFKGGGFETKTAKIVPVEIVPNAVEQLLADTINFRSKLKTVALTNNKADITFHRPVVINIDSVYIKGNGASLVSDTAYHGAAFEIGPNCRYFFLDSLIMENFDLALLVKQKGLHLKNVQFVNCRIPVQYQFVFPPARYISGSVADSVFHTDSIPK